jgi:hypothetical protein
MLSSYLVQTDADEGAQDDKEDEDDGDGVVWFGHDMERSISEETKPSKNPLSRLLMLSRTV